MDDICRHNDQPARTDAGLKVRRDRQQTIADVTLDRVFMADSMFIADRNRYG